MGLFKKIDFGNGVKYWRIGNWMFAKNKQDKLTSGTNIKTINNQSLLGSGNIKISAPSITVDTIMSDTSTNPVQNKVIKAYIDGLVGNVEAQLAAI